jgi:hypothetical protein
MAAIRYIAAGIAMIISVAVACAGESSGSIDLTAGVQSADTEATTKRNVRVIDISAKSAVESDNTHWYNRVSRPPPPKNVAKVETKPPARTEARTKKPRKNQVVRRAAPEPDAYSAYASEPSRERRGFGFFNW